MTYKYGVVPAQQPRCANPECRHLEENHDLGEGDCTISYTVGETGVSPGKVQCPCERYIEEGEDE